MLKFAPGDRVNVVGLKNKPESWNGTFVQALASGSLLVDSDELDGAGNNVRHYVTSGTVTLIHDQHEAPTWVEYKNKADVALRAIVEAAVYVLVAPDEEVDDEVEMTLDDADDVLTQLSDAWNAIDGGRHGELVDRARLVFERMATIDEALTMDTIDVQRGLDEVPDVTDNGGRFVDVGDVTLQVAREHRFAIGDLVRHVDTEASDARNIGVIEDLTWRAGDDGKALPTYTIVSRDDPGEMPTEDVHDNDDLVAI